VSSEHLPTEGEPTPREVLQALQKALHDNSSLKRATAEEVVRQINIGGYLEAKASPSLVADMLKVVRAGGFGLRSPELQPCSLELFWDASAGQVSGGIDLGLNLEWRGAPDLWEERAVPERFTHTKTPPCTDLISEAQAVLRNKERWPTHLCEAEFMSQSTGLWAEAQPFVVDSVNVHRWASLYPLPIGRRALMECQEMDDVLQWSEVLHVLPFEGDERAMWALRVERTEGTIVHVLDLFGLAEYPTERHQALGVPVAGELAFSVRGKGRSLIEILDSAERWWGQFRGLTFRGRPPVTGTWESRQQFENELHQAVAKTRAEGDKVTQENVALRLHTDSRQLRRRLRHFGLNWNEIRQS
jgi:hypothetical protein